MSTNTNTVRTFFFKFFRDGDLSDYDKLVDEHISIHCPNSWQEVHASQIEGRDPARAIDTEYKKAFKVHDVKIEEIFANGPKEEKVMARWSCEVTHVADYFGVKASNRRLSLSGMSLYSFNEKGQVVEVWQSWDMLGLLKQIGALKIVKG